VAGPGNGMNGPSRIFRARALVFPAGWTVAAAALICASTIGYATERNQRTLSILFTHDLHSQILPHTTVADDGSVRATGGFARLSTAIRRERSRRPSATLVVDAGDYSMGTLFHTLVMDRAVELRMLGMLGYDAGTFGNHDLDFRWDGVIRSLHAARTSGDRVIPLATSNLVLPQTGAAWDSLRAAFASYGVRDHLIVERNGLRIGIFALMGEDASRDCPSLEGASFTDVVAAAGKMVTLLRTQEHADVVVCLAHTGTSPNASRSENEDLAEQVPGIDVIIGGHTHRTLMQPVKIGRTLIVSAGSNGAYLGVLDIALGGGSVSATGYRLVPIDESIPEDHAVASRAVGFAEEIDTVYLRQLGLSFHKVLAQSPFSFESVTYGYAHGGELRLGDLITDAFAYAVRQAEGPDAHPVDVVIQPLGMIRHSFDAGPITVDDAFRVLSLGRGPDGQPGYPLVSTFVTGADLLTILEVGPTLASVKGDVHLQFRGVGFAFNPHRLPLNRVTRAELIGDDGRTREIHPDSLYRVCVDYYTAIMIGSLGDLSYGVVRVQPRDAAGHPVSDMEAAIIDADSRTPGVQELKEWLALVALLRSFPPDPATGVPAIPARYQTLRGWSEEQASWHPVALLRAPNQFALRAAGGVVVIAGIVLLMVLIVRQGRGRDHAGAEKGKES
jgi:5'-nucleotidase / UDP-sugar diphosphatase